MIKLSHIQPKVRSLIAADTYFDGIPVIEDTGKDDAMIEQALADAACGVVVIVEPVQGGAGETKAGASISTVELSVSIMVNAEVNPGGAGKNIFEAIEHVAAAVLGYTPQAGEQKFELKAEDQFSLSAFDTGLISYSVNFVKRTRIV